MSSTKNVFCLLNCFNNYEIVSGKIIEFYIQNAVNFLNPGQPTDIKTYFETTPFMLYETFINGNPTGLYESSQMTNFIIILALSSVTLARISNSDVTIFASQGMMPSPGFSTMYTLANQMNKKTVYWSDDLRNLWGTTDDPLFIGMTPLPYKYLWSSWEYPEGVNMYPQKKGLNGTLVEPALAIDITGKCSPPTVFPTNCCPTVNTGVFINNWNTFVNAIQSATSTSSQNTEGINRRTINMIQLGNALIQYVEVTKKQVNPNDGTGWSPTSNKSLYYDLEYTIYTNMDLLYTEEQEFLKTNSIYKPKQQTQVTESKTKLFASVTEQTKIPTNSKTDNKVNNKNKYPDFNTDKRQKLISAMAKGLERMTIMRKTI